MLHLSELLCPNVNSISLKICIELNLYPRMPIRQRVLVKVQYSPLSVPSALVASFKVSQSHNPYSTV